MDLIMNNYKKCKICNIDKNYGDYLLDSDECYKCVYAKKLATLPMRAGKIKRMKCKICQEDLPSNRWTYCSDACFLIAKRQEKHWSLSCKTDTKDWKKRFIFLTQRNHGRLDKI